MTDVLRVRVQVADNSTGVVSSDTRDVQLVATRADFGQTISRGYFRLSFDINGLTGFDSELKTQTDPIPWNATIAEMKSALEGLETIDVVEVCYGSVRSHSLPVTVCGCAHVRTHGRAHA
jgi:hypothetical protein